MNIEMERSYPTPLSNSTLLPLLLLSLARQKHTPRTATTMKFEYDYIVIGAGGAGCVVASRLSENPSVNVLILEAGKAPPMLSEVPALGRYLYDTDIDWKFKTTPQKHTGLGLIDEKIGWTTGKMLGGSGGFNGMMYVRGNHKNFDQWEAWGAKGWSFKDVFPYFLKLEDNKELFNYYHAVGGPVTFESPRYQPEVKTAVHEAAVSMGYKFNDPNAEKQTGFYEHQEFIRDNQRCNSLKAYLVPAENRTNLDIVANALVTKILIKNGRATGVQFDHKGFRYQIPARREVIVSAGTVNTPKILMLSGIGPKKQLKKFNIPVKANLPVGRNFHDHGGTNMYFTTDPHIRPFNERIADPNSILQYINSRSGPLALYEVVGSAFMRNMEVDPAIDFPNYQFFFFEMPISFIQDAAMKPKKSFSCLEWQRLCCRHYAGLRDLSLTLEIIERGNYELVLCLLCKIQVYSQFVKPYENATIYACGIQEIQPKSRGTVTLQSSNPYDPPIIDPNYLQDPTDVDPIIQGLKFCRKLLRSEPLRVLGAKEFETLIPGCEILANSEDDYFRCYAKSLFFTFHHPCGTTKMGDPDDITTVVDPQLKVKNIKGLRVVDGSIMPQAVSGNTNIPIIMIAEKASDMIKQSMFDC